MSSEAEEKASKSCFSFVHRVRTQLLEDLHKQGKPRGKDRPHAWIPTISGNMRLCVFADHGLGSKPAEGSGS